MGKWDHSFHRIQRHFIISYHIQHFQKQDPFCLDTIFHNLCFVDFYRALTAAQLQDLALGLLYLDPVCYPALRKVSYQKPFQCFCFPLRNTLLKRRIYILYQLVILFPVKLQIQFQYHICNQDPLFPVCIWLYLQ